MANDQVPRADADFLAWLTNLVNYITVNFASLGLTAQDANSLADALDQFTNTFNENIAAQQAAEGARAAKDTARDAAEALVRPTIRRIQATAGVTNQQRAAMGITIPDTTKTPVPVPSTAPIAVVDTSNHLQHRIDFRDSTNTTSRAKPFGVHAAEIYMAMTAAGTPAPLDEDAYQYVTTDTATPHIIVFDLEDAGKSVHYRIYWVNKRGERGPVSEIVSATINL